MLSRSFHRFLSWKRQYLIRSLFIIFFVLSLFLSLSGNQLQVAAVQDYWVKPRSADINENVLSEQAREELGLSEELIRTKGNSLDQVLQQVSKETIVFVEGFSSNFRPGISKRRCRVTLTHALSENSGRCVPTRKPLFAVGCWEVGKERNGLPFSE